MRVVRRVSNIVAVSVLGSVLVAAGVVMLVTPGPGLLAIAAGLALFSREFQWARRILDAARDRVTSRLGRRDRDRVSDLSRPPAAPTTDGSAERDAA